MPLVLAATGLALVAFASVAAAAWFTGRRLAALAAVCCGALLTTGYATALLVTSLRSRTTVLPPGEIKRFCGFYLDCHLGVAVEAVRYTPEIGALRAAGTFAIVTLRVSSDAVRATLRPGRLEVAVRDAAGLRRPRALAAEIALRGEQALEREVAAGGSYVVDLVFDVPEAGAAPTLEVTDGHTLDRMIELIVIGDEDSFLHRPVLLGIPR